MSGTRVAFSKHCFAIYGSGSRSPRARFPNTVLTCPHSGTSGALSVNRICNMVRCPLRCLLRCLRAYLVGALALCRRACIPACTPCRIPYSTRSACMSCRAALLVRVICSAVGRWVGGWVGVGGGRPPDRPGLKDGRGYISPPKNPEGRGIFNVLRKKLKKA